VNLPALTCLPADSIHTVARIAAKTAACAERERRLDPATVAALTDCGFPAWFVPRQWNGREGSFSALAKALALLGAADASAAWCAGLWAAHGRLAAHLPERAQQEIWGRSPRVRISSGLSPRGGRAERTADGWSLSGRWPCVSAVDSAEWLLLAATTTEPGEPTRALAVPRAQVEVLDTWDTPGMRATGSHTVLVHGAPVPDHRSFPFERIMTGAHDADAPGRARCHRAPARLVGGLIFCAPAVGAARTLLGACPADWDPEALTRASGDIDTAELLLTEAARRADTDPCPTGDLAVARNHRDAALAAELLAGVVTRLPATPSLDRARRDVLTLTTHAVLRVPSAAELYATALRAA
jgi:two-component flavin-dependent monooxygenase